MFRFLKVWVTFIRAMANAFCSNTNPFFSITLSLVVIGLKLEDDYTLFIVLILTVGWPANLSWIPLGVTLLL